MGAYKDKNGKWKCKFAYKDWENNTRWVTKRGFKTKHDALEYERNFLLKKAGSVDMRFGDFVEKYKEDVFPRIKYSTSVSRENVIDTKIVPYFENKKLNEITKNDVIAWQNMLINQVNPQTGKPYRASYIKSVHTILSSILNYAVKYYDLNENVACKVGNISRNEKPQINFWTKDEYFKFREAMMDDNFYYYIFEILYWCGIRVGELLALTPNDIDFDNGEINITKTYHHLKGKDYVTPPKTRRSVRKVTMPNFLTEELKDYLKMIYRPGDNERLFPVSDSSIGRKLKIKAKEAGVKQIRVHDLRHSHVSLLIASKKFNILEIADRVGHDSIDITLRYSHLLNSAGPNIAKTLDDLEKEG